MVNQRFLIFVLNISLIIINLFISLSFIIIINNQIHVFQGKPKTLHVEDDCVMIKEDIDISPFSIHRDNKFKDIK